jgi:SulP family sulfate permease
MSLALFVAGLTQGLIGAFRVVRLVQAAPQPVFAGFLNGVALLILVRQVLIVADRQNLTELLLNRPSSAVIYPAAFVAAFVALGLAVPRFFRPVPGPVVNLALGLALFYAVSPFLPPGALGPNLSLPGSAPWTGLLDFSAIGRTLTNVSGLVLLDVVTHGLTVAFVGVIETLMTLRLAETISHRRVGREDGILAQGIANLVGAGFAVPSCAGPTQTVVNWMSGGRGKMPQIFCCAFMALLVLVGHDVLSFVPVVVLAGHLILIAIAMIDRWSVLQLRRAIGGEDKRTRTVAVRNVLVMLAVTVTTGTGHVVLGAAVGFVIAFAMFISESARPMIRARMHGDVALSRRVRPLAELGYLRSGGARKVVLSLQGPIYFGNVVDLAREVDSMADSVDYVVLDFRRVTSIDASAVATLDHLLHAAWAEGRTIFICSVAPDLRFMLDDLPRPPSGQPLFFEDRDQALEWCEEQRLAEVPERLDRTGDAALEAMDIVRNLSAEQIDRLRRHPVPTRFTVGDYLCREGDDGNVLWLILAGDVQVRVSVGESGVMRIGTYGPARCSGKSPSSRASTAAPRSSPTARCARSP